MLARVLPAEECNDSGVICIALGVDVGSLSKRVDIAKPAAILVALAILALVINACENARRRGGWLQGRRGCNAIILAVLDLLVLPCLTRGEQIRVKSTQPAAVAAKARDAVVLVARELRRGGQGRRGRRRRCVAAHAAFSRSREVILILEGARSCDARVAG